MLGNQLPTCLCGSDTWESLGGQFGAGLNQSNFKCSTCIRLAVFLSDEGGNLLMIVRAPGADMSERVGIWFDGTIQGVWRDNLKRFKQRVEEACGKLTVSTPPKERDAAALQLADLGAGGPLALRVFPLLADPATSGHRGPLVYALLRTIGRWDPDDRPRILADTPDGKRFIDDPSAPAPLDVIRSFADGADHESQWLARHILDKLQEMTEKKQRPSYHPGIPAAPIPPRVPGDEIAVWVLRRWQNGERDWVAIDAAQTQDLPVPPDPIRVRHDAYFSAVFEAVGLSDEPRVEIPNRYYRDTFNKEPWYEFNLGSFKLTIGPRKRVVSITVESEDVFDPTPLQALGAHDGVTYEDDQWKSDKKQARSATIHAWTEEKCIEYLDTILNQIVRAHA